MRAIALLFCAGCWTSSKTSSSGPIIGAVTVRNGELIYTTCGFDYVTETDHDLTRSLTPTSRREHIVPQACGEAHVPLEVQP